MRHGERSCLLRTFSAFSPSKHASSLDSRSFSYFDVKASTWQADAGTYTLQLGDSSQNIQQKTTIQLPKIPVTPVSD
jgi:beta-glucosidase